MFFKCQRLKKKHILIGKNEMNLWKAVQHFLKRLTELPLDPAGPLLDLHPRELTTYIYTRACTPTAGQPRWQSNRMGTDRPWCITQP